MGMAAAQAKLLSLTARRSDINYQLSSLMRGKLDLMTQASNAADALSAAQRNNNIFVMTTSDNQQTQLSFNSLSKEGLTIVDAKGRTIVPSSYRGNVKGLANVLPASHPAVKSYDGDFVPKTKLTKNYVSIPENTIPMFAETDPENREQKTVKKYESNEIDINTLSGIEEYYNAALSYGNLYEFFGKNNTIGLVLSNENNFADYKETEAVGKGNNYTYANYNVYTSDYCKRQQDLDTLFVENFRSECGEQIDTESEVGKLNNVLMGGDNDKNIVKRYTEYKNREFQTEVNWATSKNVINNHIRNSNNKEITYVSNAEQFITALLKKATVTTNEGLQSNANIMLLNDIDLDDMLQDEDGKGGLKAFIQNEISTLDFNNADDKKKTAYNNAMNTFLDVTNSVYNDNNWKNNENNICKMFENLATAYGINTSNLSGKNIIEKINNISDDVIANWSSEQKQFRKNAQDLYTLFEVIEQKDKKRDIELSNGAKLTKNECSDWSKLSSQIAAAAAAAAVGGTESKSGIDASVLANVYAKYFSCGTNDKFNEDFTNFIQIDKFTGAIGGGGFAINNLKMHGTEEASMFKTLDNATIHGVYMENANVLTNSKNEYKAAILAQEVKKNSLTIMTIRGNALAKAQAQLNAQTTTTTLDKYKEILNSTANYRERYASLVYKDMRNAKNMKSSYEDIGGLSPIILESNNERYYSTGWSFESMKELDATGFLTSRNYGTITTGIRMDAERTTSNNASVSFSSNDVSNDLGSGASEACDMRKGSKTIKQAVNKQSASTALLTAARAISGEISNKTPKEIENKSLFNGKIRLFQTKTETKADKNKEISGWDKDIDWDNWEYVDENFVDNDGSVTLVKKHGEETEEYLQIKDLLEFYKEQNVRVEYDENRETGCFTYSASGYSIDVEYKEDLNKYLSDNYLYKVENNDSSIVVYERDKVVDIDSSQLVFVDDIEAVLDKNIKNGVWFVQGASVSDASKYERKSLDEIGISETTDEKADAVAQAEYDRKIREIEIQEEKYDAQITELESTLKGIEQEIENQEKIVKQNIQSSFSTFSS